MVTHPRTNLRKRFLTSSRYVTMVTHPTADLGKRCLISFWYTRQALLYLLSVYIHEWTDLSKRCLTLVIDLYAKHSYWIKIIFFINTHWLVTKLWSPLVSEDRIKRKTKPAQNPLRRELACKGSVELHWIFWSWSLLVQNLDWDLVANIPLE